MGMDDDHMTKQDINDVLYTAADYYKLSHNMLVPNIVCDFYAVSETKARPFDKVFNRFTDVSPAAGFIFYPNYKRFA
jgi:hypothetical protein